MELSIDVMNGHGFSNKVCFEYLLKETKAMLCYFKIGGALMILQQQGGVLWFTKQVGVCIAKGLKQG